MKIKIVSDGTAFNTQIVDADTGEDLELPVTELSFRIVAGQATECVMRMDFVQLEMKHSSEMVDAFITKMKPRRLKRRTERR